MLCFSGVFLRCVLVDALHHRVRLYGRRVTTPSLVFLRAGARQLLFPKWFVPGVLEVAGCGGSSRWFEFGRALYSDLDAGFASKVVGVGGRDIVDLIVFFFFFLVFLILWRLCLRI